MMQVQKDNYLYHSKEECCQVRLCGIVCLDVIVFISHLFLNSNLSLVKNHFWWRIQQCMGNQKVRSIAPAWIFHWIRLHHFSHQSFFVWPLSQCITRMEGMLYSYEYMMILVNYLVEPHLSHRLVSFCDQKVYFEDYESKYTPGQWSTSSQFDTLRECCVAKFWYDVEGKFWVFRIFISKSPITTCLHFGFTFSTGCIAASPKELTFTFSFTVDNMVLPTNCQDADIQGNALEVAINVGLGSSSISQVTEVGCATLSRDPGKDNFHLHICYYTIWLSQLHCFFHRYRQHYLRWMSRWVIPRG